MSRGAISPEIQVGRRFQVDDGKGSKGFIRFVGHLNEKETKKKPKVYVGVEWDEEGRGKNNGSVEGVSYFECPAGQGSFLHPQRVIVGVSFTKALADKYAAPADAEADHERFLVAQHGSGKKFAVPVVFVGQQEMIETQSQLDKLVKVAVCDAAVAHFGEPGELQKTCPAIQELDLENNLLHGWQQVVDLASQLRLKELRLSRNCIQPESTPERITLQWTTPFHNIFPGLQRLFLNDVPHAWHHVLLLAATGCLPALQELNLCNNGLKTFGDLSGIECKAESFKDVFPELRFLNVSNNNIPEWNELEKFRDLPKLEKVLANNNAIKEITYQPGTWLELNWVSLTDNPIGDWASVDALNTFPKLSNVRLQRSPVIADVGEGLGRAIIIAKLAKIQTLNYSFIQPRQRVDAEKVYLKYCMQQFTSKGLTGKPNDHFPRFQELVELHGEPIMGKQNPNEKGHTLAKRLCEVQLKVLSSQDLSGPVETERKKKLPNNMTVAKFQVLIGRLLKVDLDEYTVLYRATPDADVETIDDAMKQLSFYGIADGGEVLLRPR